MNPDDIKKKLFEIYEKANTAAKGNINAVKQGIYSSTGNTPTVSRALVTDLDPQIQAIKSKMPVVKWGVGNPIKPEGFDINTGAIANTALDWFTGGKYSPEEQAYYKKVQQNQPLTPQDVQTGKNLAQQDSLKVMGMMAGPKAVGGQEAIVRGGIKNIDIPEGYTVKPYEGPYTLKGAYNVVGPDGKDFIIKADNPSDIAKRIKEQIDFNKPVVKTINPIRQGDSYGNMEIGKADTGEMVARERFNIPELKKIGAGSDRDVYDLGNGQVIKISKSSRGLTQNSSSADYYASDAGLIPETLEVGKNYVVKEKVDPPSPEVKKMVKELQSLSTYELNNERAPNHYKEQQKAIDILTKYGFPGEEVQNYGNILWGDMTRIKNWGTKNGAPIMLDEGTLNGNLVTGNKVGGKNLMDPEFRQIYEQSKKAKKQYGDIDKITMYGLGGLGIIGGSKLLKKQKTPEEKIRSGEL